MRARDVMTTNIITASPSTPVAEIAAMLLSHRISAVPVVHADNRVVGIVSEGDLLHRTELGTEERHRSWWLTLFTGPEAEAADFVKAHGRRAADVMTREVISIEEDTELRDIAQLLEERRIKRVPVLRDGRLVGIVSRADLLRGLVAAPPPRAATADDEALRRAALDRLRREDWAAGLNINVIVTDGVAHLWGYVDAEAQRDALRIAVCEVPGIVDAEDHLAVAPPAYGGGL